MAANWPRFRSKAEQLKAIAYAVFALLALAAGSYSVAATDRYDYDSLGRLVRHVDAQGRATEYVYDAAGNLQQVSNNATAQAPAITAITPTSLRRGEAKLITVTGTGLTGIAASVADAQLTLTGLQFSASQVSFTLAASTTAALGSSVLNFANALGTASATLTINPVLPQAAVAPPATCGSA